MNAAGRSAVTLGVLGLLVVVAALWGWSALTAPFPEQEEPPPCVDREVAAGDKLFRDQVTVSVYNASRRSGLAGATSAQLEERGFHVAGTGNAPRGTRVRAVEIWAADARHPAVKLVRSQLNRTARVVEGEDIGAGVVLILGDGFGGLAKGRESVRVRRDTTVCGPAEES
mgnify:CR=1 FL=1